jgi:hypothetical protein
MKIKLEGVTISFDHEKQDAVRINYDGDPDKIDEIRSKLAFEGVGRFSNTINPEYEFASDFMLAIACVYRVNYKIPEGVTLFNPPGEEDGVN